MIHKKRMKQILLILVLFVLGEFFFKKIRNFSTNFSILVFSVYKSISTDEHNNINLIYHDEFAEKVIDSNIDEDLKLAQDKIKKLEERIDDLENRIPKKYENVKFLNYQVRKRILVTGKISSFCAFI